MGFCGKLRSVLRLQYTKIPTLDYEDFHKPQWNWHPAIYCAYRVITAVYCTCWVGVSAHRYYNREPQPVPWVAFLTNWTFCLICIYLWTSLVVFLILQGCERFKWKRPCSSRCLSRIVCGMFYICVPTAFYVTTVYYGAFFPYLALRGEKEFEVSDFHLHAVNTIVTIAETLIVRYPVRFMHILFVYLFAQTWCTENLWFWFTDPTHHIVYPIINEYSVHPLEATGAVLFMALLLIPACQLAFLGLQKVRIKLSNK